MRQRDDKLEKIMALASSPNKNEAMNAMRKAREYIKSKEKDRIEHAYLYEEYDELEERRTNIFYSQAKDPWIQDLGLLVSQRCGCAMYIIRKQNGSRKTIVLFGHPDNVDITEKSLELSIGHLHQHQAVLKKRADYDKNAFNSYAFGYIDGLKKVYLKQDQEGGAAGAISITVPEDANERLRLITQKTTVRPQMKDSEYSRGFIEGNQ